MGYGGAARYGDLNAACELASNSDPRRPIPKPLSFPLFLQNIWGHG